MIKAGNILNNMDDLRKALDEHIPIEYTAHCQKRMLERDIKRADIINCIRYGTIIEDYPLNDGMNSEKSLPSCLIFGRKVNSTQVIHVVIGYNRKKILMISACYPDSLHWMDDFMTRRK